MDSRESLTVLALDVGARRIGAAVGQAPGGLGRPLPAIARRNRDADVAAVGRLAAEHGATLLVVGLPEGRDEDQLSEAAVRIQSFGRRLARRLGIPVEFMDESLSTMEAEEAMIEADLSRTKRREVIDSAAAAVILRRWLEARP